MYASKLILEGVDHQHAVHFLSIVSFVSVEASFEVPGEHTSSVLSPSPCHRMSSG